MTLSFLIYRN